MIRTIFTVRLCEQTKGEEMFIRRRWRRYAHQQNEINVKEERSLIVGKGVYAFIKFI